MKKYRTFTNQLLAFAKDRGCVRLSGIRVTDIDAFYTTWKDGANSEGKKLERMKGFFEFCRKRKWIESNPAEDLEPPVNYSQRKQKSPYTDEELNRIFDGASKWKPSPWHNAGQWGVVTAEQVVTFVMLLNETGLRISDAATFNVPERVNSETHECFLFMHKTGKPLYIWINPDLYARLQVWLTSSDPRRSSPNRATRSRQVTPGANDSPKSSSPPAPSLNIRRLIGSAIPSCVFNCSVAFPLMMSPS